MADPNTLQAAVDSLEAEGVTRIAVVRLFLSGASFLDQTEFLLGLRAEPPAQVMLHGGAGQGGHGGHLAPLAHRARFLLGREGLSSASMVPTILAERAGAAAPAADRPVLVLAHGMGDEDENRALLGDMERTADAIRSLGFREVRSATLREDWPEERVRAEADIRRWAASVVAPGREVVVVPYRLFGFGPYAEVLAGLPHCGTEGIVPHPLVTRWIREQATALLCADVERGPAEGCPNSGAPRG
jgi:sirohydrochlorin ferrochelatase